MLSSLDLTSSIICWPCLWNHLKFIIINIIIIIIVTYETIDELRKDYWKTFMG